MQTPIENTTQLTPIEKAIEYYNRCKNVAIQYGSPVSVEQDIDSVINSLTELLPYERQYLRDVADKAFEAGSDFASSKMLPSLKSDTPDKQTYLNQNHPL